VLHARRGAAEWSALRADISAMRETTERMDRRMASLQQSVAQFERQLSDMEQPGQELVRDLATVAEKISDSHRGPLSKARAALGGT
jgi:septal ring factor EnvC (AmiA/AmiB activator)